MIPRARHFLQRKFVQDTLILQVGKVASVLLSFVSTVTVLRLMGPAIYGIFVWAQSLLAIWGSLDLTGIGTSTRVRLAIAVGARDEGAILDLMAFYVKISTAVNVALAISLALFGPIVAQQLYNGNAQVGVLAAWLAVGAFADAFYNLVIIALQSRRSMRTFMIMQDVNQLVLTTALIAAVLISPTPESLVIARLVYSYSTLLIALIVYYRLREQGRVSYPPFSAVLRRAVTVSPRPYWRFGVANAIDRNIAQLFTQIPLQLIGIIAGPRAVGYMSLAMSGITQAGELTSAVFDNMQAVVPQAVGRGDFAGLKRNFVRVLVVMLLGGTAFYTALALLAPPFIPLLLGSRWIPAIPALMALAIYGALTTTGGLFGPLYRAFDQMRQIIVVKLIALGVGLPLGLLILTRMVAATPGIERFAGATALIPYRLIGGSVGALGGALLIDLIFFISITLTAAVTLPELWKRAR